MPAKLDARFAPDHSLDVRAKRTLDDLWQRAMAPFTHEEPLPAPSDEELAYAQEKGYWQPDERAGHDATIARLLTARDQVDLRQAGRAFALGLAWNRPDWWGILGSAAFARHLAPHPNKAGDLSYVCAVCGLPRIEGSRTDELASWSPGEGVSGLLMNGPMLSVLPVTSHLNFFARFPHFPAPNEAEWARVKRLLEICREADPRTTAPQLAKSLKELGIKNPEHRLRVVEMLAAAGILAPRDSAGAPMSYFHRWIDFTETQVGNPRDDTQFPARAWRGGHGVDEDAVEFWFGDGAR